MGPREAGGIVGAREDCGIGVGFRAGATGDCGGGAGIFSRISMTADSILAISRVTWL